LGPSHSRNASYWRAGEAVILIGRSLKLRVAAEGVEREEQLAFLRAHGCELAQGCLISRRCPPKMPLNGSAVLPVAQGMSVLSAAAA
jgi:EAL domain-containing protein (putative c-di-GMP-specific phosphodiesterase class I)